jgi:hypothetical protein
MPLSRTDAAVSTPCTLHASPDSSENTSREASVSTLLCALGASASSQASVVRVTRAASASMTGRRRSRSPVFVIRTSMTTAVSPGTHTVVVSRSRPGRLARRTARSGRHSWVTGTP